jgi:phage-related protein
MRLLCKIIYNILKYIFAMIIVLFKISILYAYHIISKIIINIIKYAIAGFLMTYDIISEFITKFIDDIINTSNRIIRKGD